MIREVDINEISDGKRYKSNDLVKISCNDCNGCSKCCKDMGNSIVLDPYDIFSLELSTGKSFEELLSDSIELNVVDGLILPNIKMQEDSLACIFLSDSGRCTIHDSRPGFCRLFPLGRIYEDGEFSYFHQINECDYQDKSKIKIKKWLGIDRLSEYEKYINHYHDLQKRIISKFTADTSEAVIKSIDMMVLNKLFVEKYDLNSDFYEQYYRRCEQLIF